MRLALAGMLAAFFLGRDATAQPVATNTRLGEHAEHTRFVLDLSETVDYRVFTLNKPYRIVLELPEIDWRLPAKAGTRGAGLVKTYRYGIFGHKRSRVVLDLAGPARIGTHFVMPPEDGRPARLVLDLVPATEDEFNEGAGWPTAAAAAPSEPAADAPSESKPINNRDGRFVIVLDAGHGGVDPGASSASGTHEKDIVLEMTKAVRAELQKRARYEVVVTRDDDTFLTLKDRVRAARAAKADLFISIHADSMDSDVTRGASIYTLSEKASDKEAEELAKSENAADVISGVDLSGENDEVTNILIDLAQRETKNRSVTFAQMTLPQLASHTALLPEPHRFAGFRVLKAPDVPSVLIELGFLSNSTEVERLTSAKWRKGMARALGRAVDAYYERMSSYADSQGGAAAH
jgi:N-acetylmuramoyl-L-alanine amidase